MTLPQVTILLGLPFALGLWIWLARGGDWRLSTSDIALVECEEEEVPPHAPELDGWNYAGQVMMLLSLLLIVANLL